jgi:hypothetical protein
MLRTAVDSLDPIGLGNFYPSFFCKSVTMKKSLCEQVYCIQGLANAVLEPAPQLFYGTHYMEQDAAKSHHRKCEFIDGP